MHPPPAAEMIQRVRFEQWIPVPLDRVFHFSSNPTNLPRLMPPELDAEIRSIEGNPSASAGVGTQITQVLPERHW